MVLLVSVEVLLSLILSLPLSPMLLLVVSVGAVHYGFPVLYPRSKKRACGESQIELADGFGLVGFFEDTVVGRRLRDALAGFEPFLRHVRREVGTTDVDVSLVGRRFVGVGRVGSELVRHCRVSEGGKPSVRSIVVMLWRRSATPSTLRCGGGTASCRGRCGRVPSAVQQRGPWCQEPSVAGLGSAVAARVVSWLSQLSWLLLER